jgi:Na+-translocating ferredoxin:NAD+ oxidoreductase RnfD subunit
MAGYVFLLISYPVATTTWLPPNVPELLAAQDLATLSFMDSARLIFTGALPAEHTWDAVSACTTRRGQLIYGFAIGALVFVIRTWGGYPDAVAFAVLLLNIAAPMIDHYTQPRVFGQKRSA